MTVDPMDGHLEELVGDRWHYSSTSRYRDGCGLTSFATDAKTVDIVRTSPTQGATWRS